MSCRIVFSGGYCTGKSTLMQMLSREFSIQKVPDHTTRPKRAWEREDNHYSFISPEVFEENQRAGIYFATVCYDGYFYGAPKEPLFSRENWLMDIVSSYWPLFREIPGVIGIYLDAPSSLDELRERAIQRGSSSEEIERRLQLLNEENPEGFDVYIPGDLSIAEKYERVRKIVIQHGLVPRRKRS